MTLIFLHLYSLPAITHSAAWNSTHSYIHFKYPVPDLPEKWMQLRVLGWPPGQVYKQKTCDTIKFAEDEGDQQINTFRQRKTLDNEYNSGGDFTVNTAEKVIILCYSCNQTVLSANHHWLIFILWTNLCASKPSVITARNKVLERSTCEPWAKMGLIWWSGRSKQAQWPCVQFLVGSRDKKDHTTFLTASAGHVIAAAQAR